MKADFDAAGATLVALSPQSRAKSQELIAKRGLGFEILRDARNDVAAAYGLRHLVEGDLRGVYQGFGIDLPAANGDDSWTLPIPARYLIDRAGVVRWASKSADYTRRPEPAETIAALAEIA